jgi:hypothetical protein
MRIIYRLETPSKPTSRMQNWTEGTSGKSWVMKSLIVPES